jgi:predicted Holliday junction resolvase-like endonuclease
MDVLGLLNIFPSKLKFLIRISIWFFFLTIIVAILAYILIQARTKIQKLKDDYENEKIALEKQKEIESEITLEKKED